MLANYHTHTTRCKHASGEDREYIETAIEAGMKVLGFSDHCPWYFEDPEYVSGTRMLPNQLEEYVTSMHNYKKEYASDITIYVGLESEYIPAILPKQLELIASLSLPLDYQILGQHFCLPEHRGPYMGFDFSREADLKQYVDFCIAAMETGRYRYIAHPDLFHYIGPDELYHKHMLRLCRYLKSHGIPVEINLLGVYENRHYTSKKFLQIAKEAGCSAIIGADAHFPARLNCPEAENKCVALAEEFSLPLITYLPGLGPL